jgi:hypothetical protein
MLRLKAFEETRARDDSEWRRTLREAQERQDRFTAGVMPQPPTCAHGGSGVAVEEQLLAAQAAVQTLEARLGRLEIESATLGKSVGAPFGDSARSSMSLHR